MMSTGENSCASPTGRGVLPPKQWRDRSRACSNSQKLQAESLEAHVRLATGNPVIFGLVDVNFSVLLHGLAQAGFKNLEGILPLAVQHGFAQLVGALGDLIGRRF